jgi:hypothetical protein
MPRIRLPFVAALGFLGCGVTGCGGMTVKQPRISSPAACIAGHDPGACLQFLDALVAVRSIRLTTKVPPQVASTCRAAARMTRVTVVCPPVVPAGGVVHDHDLHGPQIVDRRSYSVSINNGQNPGHIHWEFGAIRGPATRLWVFDRKDWEATPSTPSARRIGTRRYLGHVISIYRFPENGGQLGGHDAAFAAEAGMSYFVSIHGHIDDADIAMLLAILLARNP